jgi:hypothetical protein
VKQSPEKKKETNQYDKVIRENLDITLPVIIRDLLRLDVFLSEGLPDGIQYTKERKADSLRKVTDSSGNTYVLQIEFQVKDEKEMVYRMAEYYVMLLRKYKVPVKQFVIFLSDSNPKMVAYLNTENMKYNFSIIKIADMDYQIFLNSDDPEIKMLAILANFGENDALQVVESIVKGIDSITKNSYDKQRYNEQLRVFVQLRKDLEQLLNTAMQSVSTWYKEENDFLYRKGRKLGVIEGKLEEKREVVESLIKKLKLSDNNIADLANVDIDFVKRVRQEINNK